MSMNISGIPGPTGTTRIATGAGAGAGAGAGVTAPVGVGVGVGSGVGTSSSSLRRKLQTQSQFDTEFDALIQSSDDDDHGDNSDNDYVVDVGSASRTRTTSRATSRYSPGATATATATAGPQGLAGRSSSRSRHRSSSRKHKSKRKKSKHKSKSKSKNHASSSSHSPRRRNGSNSNSNNSNNNKHDEDDNDDNDDADDKDIVQHAQAYAMTASESSDLLSVLTVAAPSSISVPVSMPEPVSSAAAVSTPESSHVTQQHNSNNNNSSNTASNTNTTHNHTTPTDWTKQMDELLGTDVEDDSQANDNATDHDQKTNHASRATNNSSSQPQPHPSSPMPTTAAAAAVKQQNYFELSDIEKRRQWSIWLGVDMTSPQMQPFISIVDAACHAAEAKLPRGWVENRQVGTFSLVVCDTARKVTCMHPLVPKFLQFVSERRDQIKYNVPYDDDELLADDEDIEDDDEDDDEDEDELMDRLYGEQYLKMLVDYSEPILPPPQSSSPSPSPSPGIDTAAAAAAAIHVPTQLPQTPAAHVKSDYASRNNTLSPASATTDLYTPSPSLSKKQGSRLGLDHTPVSISGAPTAQMYTPQNHIISSASSPASELSRAKMKSYHTPTAEVAEQDLERQKLMHASEIQEAHITITRLEQENQHLLTAIAEANARASNNVSAEENENLRQQLAQYQSMVATFHRLEHERKDEKQRMQAEAHRVSQLQRDILTEQSTVREQLRAERQQLDSEQNDFRAQMQSWRRSQEEQRREMDKQKSAAQQKQDAMERTQSELQAKLQFLRTEIRRETDRRAQAEADWTARIKCIEEQEARVSHANDVLDENVVQGQSRMAELVQMAEAVHAQSERVACKKRETEELRAHVAAESARVADRKATVELQAKAYEEKMKELRTDMTKLEKEKLQLMQLRRDVAELEIKTQEERATLHRAQQEIIVERKQMAHEREMMKASTHTTAAVAGLSRDTSIVTSGPPSARSSSSRRHTPQGQSRTTGSRHMLWADSPQGVSLSGLSAIRHENDDENVGDVMIDETQLQSLEAEARRMREFLQSRPAIPKPHLDWHTVSMSESSKIIAEKYYSGPGVSNVASSPVYHEYHPDVSRPPWLSDSSLHVVAAGADAGVGVGVGVGAGAGTGAGVGTGAGTGTSSSLSCDMPASTIAYSNSVYGSVAAEKAASYRRPYYEVDDVGDGSIDSVNNSLGSDGEAIVHIIEH
jgi:hypothetical protein